MKVHTNRNLFCTMNTEFIIQYKYYAKRRKTMLKIEKSQEQLQEKHWKNIMILNELKKKLRTKEESQRKSWDYLIRKNTQKQKYLKM